MMFELIFVKSVVELKNYYTYADIQRYFLQCLKDSYCLHNLCEHYTCNDSTHLLLLCDFAILRQFSVHCHCQ